MRIRDKVRGGQQELKDEGKWEEPKGNCWSQISRIPECASLYSRGNSKPWLELRLWIRWLWKEEIKPILSNRSNDSTRLSNRSNESTKAHQSGERKKKELRRDMRIWNSWLWRCSKGPWAKECRRPLEAEKGHVWDYPLELPLETWADQHLDFHSVTYISGYGPSESQDKLPLFNHYICGNLL